MNVGGSTAGNQITIEQQMEGIIYADQTRNIMFIANQIAQCILQHNLSLQQIETVLREKNCFTFLIARERNESHGDDIVFQLPNSAEKTYFLFFSTKDQQHAIKEMLEESSSCEENFEKLNDTGFLCPKPNKPLVSQFKSGTLVLNKKGTERVLSELFENSNNEDTSEK